MSNQDSMPGSSLAVLSQAFQVGSKEERLLSDEVDAVIGTASSIVLES
jgi:hypothetical protein